MSLEDHARTVLAESEELLTVKEFSNLFGRHVGALYRALKKGRYPEAKKIGGQWYIRISQRDLSAARNSDTLRHKA